MKDIFHAQTIQPHQYHLEKTMTAHTRALTTPNRTLAIALWAIQGLMFAAFLLFGVQKLFIPPEALAAMWQTQWPLQMPILLKVTGLFDVAGGLGLLLPSVSRIRPGLTVTAALCCGLLQISAIVFHVSRGEFGSLPLNAILLPLVLFIFWGRWKKYPILSKNPAN